MSAPAPRDPYMGYKIAGAVLVLVVLLVFLGFLPNPFGSKYVPAPTPAPMPTPYVDIAPAPTPAPAPTSVPTTAATVSIPLPTTCSGASASQYQMIGNQISPGTTLKTCQGLQSADKRYILVQQSDGNLVLYDTVFNKPTWAINNHGATNLGSSLPNNTTYQSDYNFVTYNNGGNAIWASNTAGKTSTSLVMQEDGNLVIYSENPVHSANSWTGKSVWTSGTGSQSVFSMAGLF